MKVEHKQNYAVLHLPDKLAVFNDNIELFEAIMLTLFKAGYRKVVLDFSQLVRIDTKGLSALLINQKKLKDRGGELLIRNIKSKEVLEKFRLIDLKRVIDIIDSKAV